MEGFTQKPSFDKGQVSSHKLTDIFFNQSLRYKGIFDLPELYRIIHSWLVSKGFEVHESKYKSIVLPGGAKERSFDWFAFKKGNEFVMVHMMIHFQFQDIQQIEVVENGEKKMLNKGLMFIRVAQELDQDWSERFAYSKLHKVILRFMADFMWQKKVETYWEDKARFKAYELMNVIKEAMEFMTKGNEHYDVW
jgi:hypothetical protein